MSDGEARDDYPDGPLGPDPGRDRRDRPTLFGVAPWVLLTLGWGLLTAAKLPELTSAWGVVGLLASVALAVGGGVGLGRLNVPSRPRVLAGGLFAVGVAATLLSVPADVAVFPDDAITVVADVTILEALAVTLAAKVGLL